MDEKNDIFEGICGACKRTFPKGLKVYALNLIDFKATTLAFVTYEEDVVKHIQICPYCGTIKVLDHD